MLRPAVCPSYRSRSCRGITLKALFDTGSPQLLSLRAQDYQRIGGRAGVQCLSRSYGESNMGISGQRQEEEAMRVGIPALSVGSVKFESVVTTTAEAPVSLLGTELLTYGRITIDYPRRRLYYEAYRPDETHRPEGRYADVELTVKEGHLVVARVWGEGYEGIAPGDRGGGNKRETGRYIRLLRGVLPKVFPR